MNSKYLFDVDAFIKNALLEDIGAGDHTSLSTIPANASKKARLIVKEAGIIAGVELALKIFRKADRGLRVFAYKRDGERVKKGDLILTVAGNARSILKTERLVLNCMQRMSGIATQTHKMVRLCKPYKTKLLDTRKTTPLLRGLEKWAVRIGGGYNHRFGLYDMILIKNNHIDFAGGVGNAVASVKKYLRAKKINLTIEAEARNLKEAEEILSAGGIDRILLDNFSPASIKKAVRLIKGKAEIEISGGITEKNIRKYARLGADYISSGALTHSVKSLDMSLTAF